MIQAAVVASARTTVVRSTLSARYSVAAMALGDRREVMQVKKLSENAVMPVRGSEHAAGFDLARYARYAQCLLPIDCTVVRSHCLFSISARTTTINTVFVVLCRYVTVISSLHAARRIILVHKKVHMQA